MLKNLLFCLLSFSLFGCAASFKKISFPRKKESMEEKQLVSKNEKHQKNPLAVIDTNFGVITIELFKTKAPKTVQNFVSLAQAGFYNQLYFHRVIKGFVIQGGDPKGDGSGGPGYTIMDEIDPSLKHDKVGVVAMAHRGPNTAGSQFYITLAATPWLNGGYTVFGQTIRGFDVLEKIASVETDHNNKPIENVVIRNIIINV